MAALSSRHLEHSTRPFRAISLGPFGLHREHPRKPRFKALRKLSDLPKSRHAAHLALNVLHERADENEGAAAAPIGAAELLLVVRG